MWCYSRYWATGRHWYAIGNDVAAARLAGIRVHRRTIAAYAVTGLFVGLAGWFSSAPAASPARTPATVSSCG